MESYSGAVQRPHDAVLLLEASRIGLIPRVKRRLKDSERAMIKAGDVYIWNEKEAKMRRWTDGRSWSASRVTGAFLTYREMESAEKPVGSNYRYKDNGLIKQSFSITTSSGDKLHLISYTTTMNFSRSKLMDKTPSQDPAFSHIDIPYDLYPQLGNLTHTSRTSSPAASSTNSSPKSEQRLSSTPTSTNPSPIASPQQIPTLPKQRPATQLQLPEISIPRSMPKQVTLPPIQTSTMFPSSRGGLIHDDAMALRHLDKMSFK